MLVARYTSSAKHNGKLFAPGVFLSYGYDQKSLYLIVKPGFHMIETVDDVSPRQARGHIGTAALNGNIF